MERDRGGSRRRSGTKAAPDSSSSCSECPIPERFSGLVMTSEDRCLALSDAAAGNCAIVSKIQWHQSVERLECKHGDLLGLLIN